MWIDLLTVYYFQSYKMMKKNISWQSEIDLDSENEYKDIYAQNLGIISVWEYSLSRPQLETSWKNT